MSPSTVLQRQRLALLSRQRKSTRDPALRRQLVHRCVLAPRTIASSLSPISGFQPVRIFQAQQRVLDERFSFISPSPIICCIAGLTPDNNSVTSSIDNQCNAYTKTDLWKRVRGPWKNLFASFNSAFVFTTTMNQTSSCWSETRGRDAIST